jgi:hypothetical protein
MKQKETDCFSRFEALHGSLDEFVDFLIEENLMSQDNIGDFRRASNRPKFLHSLLLKHKQEDKIMLLDFEWVLLPIERIKITIVTERTSKSFTYNHV